MAGILTPPGVSVEITPLSPSQKLMAVPDYAAMLILGAKPLKVHGGWQVKCENDTIQMHGEDYSLALAAARKAMPLIDKAKTGVITPMLALLGITRRMTSELVFHPGRVKVLYLPVIIKGGAFYRCVLPSAGLNRGSRVEAHCSFARVEREAAPYDVVVFQIAHQGIDIQFAKMLKEMGKRIVYEIDDAFDAMETWHPQYEAYRSPDRQKNVREMMKLADAVTVTTENLKERYGDFARRIEVIPNSIHLGEWPKAEPLSGKEFRILWAGSPSHSKDLDVAAAGLAEFMGHHPEAVFYCFGHTPPAGLPAARVRKLPFVEYENYPEALADVQAHVAIAPLVDNAFNQAKSNVKLLEYGATGYPVIASAVGEYKKAADMAYVLGCAKSEDWYAALSQMHANLGGLREKYQEGSLALARLNDIDRNSAATEEFFVSLMR